MTSNFRSLTTAVGLAILLVSVVSAVVGYRFGTGYWPGLDELSGNALGEAAATKDGTGQPAVTASSGSHSGNPAATKPPVPMTPAGGERKLLYYRNPMGLPDTSPVPKKDWMGMDYIAVYEGDAPEDQSTIQVSLDKVQRAGVRSEAAEMRAMARPIRAPGTAKFDERTLRSITLRFDGYIEKLYANVHGQMVKEGETLFEVYSPELQSATVDYRRQVGTAGARSREDASYYAKSIDLRFRNLALPDRVIREIRNSGSLPRRIEWPSPSTGTVIEKKVVEGQMVKAGEELYRLADLSNIWVIADVSEQDLASVRIGAPAKVQFRALPDQKFSGHVAFILHELDPATRTAKVRVEVDNPEHRIRHEMFADVEIDVGSDEAKRLVVPASAIIDSGTRQVVIIDKGEGRFEPRPITPGFRGDGMVEVTKGLEAGEKVVTAANFLIDAESNIKAALEAFAPEAQSVGRNEQSDQREPPRSPTSSGEATP